MKNKIGITILIIILGGGIFIIFNSSSNTSSAKTPTTQIYSMTDVSSHKDAKSCWTAINGNVYDLTSWIDEHPGGREAILYICGKDGTEAFNTQHGGQARPEAELKAFLIGKLK